MSSLSDYDKRQINVMLQKINDFEQGDIPLSILINDLEALMEILEDEDNNWKKRFRAYWWNLEQIYAVALDENKNNLDANDEKVIGEAIQNLRKLINLKRNGIN